MSALSRIRIAVVIAAALIPAAIVAQEPAAAPGPCHEQPCALSFDWGNGTSAAALPNDRRYGSPSDFEASLKQTLTEHGLRITDDDRNAKTSIRLRMSMTSAICDFMPGTNTDRSCKTVRDVALSFVNTDPAAKKIGATRLTNRCGASDQVMSTTQFGRYTALMIDFLIEGEAKKLQRPTPKC